MDFVNVFFFGTNGNKYTAIVGDRREKEREGGGADKVKWGGAQTR